MCKYKDICPAYDKFSESCNKTLQYGSAKCIPLLLEAYHSIKGTDKHQILPILKEIDEVKGFKMITVLDVLKTCDKEYQEMIYKNFEEALRGD